MAFNNSRRAFLKKTSAYTAAGISASSTAPFSSALAGNFKQKPKVVEAIDTDCIIDDSLNVDEERIQDMVDHAIMELTGIYNKPKAYEALFPEQVTTSTTIAIKKNGISGNKTSKSYGVVLNSLKNGLTSMLGGFPEENITITIGRGSASPSNPSFSIGSYKYIIEDIWVNSDWIINAPVCWGNTPTYGVTLSLKNMMSTVGGSSLQNMHGFEQNENSPWKSILNSQPTFKEKRVLTIIDAIMGRYRDGPGGRIDYQAHRILVSKDTIACDYYGLQILKGKGLSSSLEKSALKILELAVKSPYNLGTNDPNMINFVPIEAPWNTDIKSVDKKRQSDSQVKVTANSAGSGITFSSPLLKGRETNISIFDMHGRQVWVYRGTSGNNIVWNGKDIKGGPVSSGMYLYKLTAGDYITNGKVRIKQ